MGPIKKTGILFFLLSVRSKAAASIVMHIVMLACCVNMIDTIGVVGRQITYHPNYCCIEGTVIHSCPMPDVSDCVRTSTEILRALLSALLPAQWKSFWANKRDILHNIFEHSSLGVMLCVTGNSAVCCVGCLSCPKQRILLVL